MMIGPEPMSRILRRSLRFGMVSFKVEDGQSQRTQSHFRLFRGFRGITPRDTIGGRPKKRGRQAQSHSPTPPPPANRNWRKGSNSSRKTQVLICRQGQLAQGGSPPPVFSLIPLLHTIVRN